MHNLDTVLKPGQKVRVVRTVAIAFDVDIRDYLLESGGEDITVGALIEDVSNNLDAADIMDQWDDTEETDISTEVTEVL
jgi:hypothetical protein